MKFKERVYLITLIVFLIFFNVGIFTLAYYVYSTSVDSEVGIAYSEEKVIVESFENDIKYLGNNRIEQIAKSYLAFYDDKSIYLSFISDDKEYSNLPLEIDFNIKSGYSSIKRINNRMYFIIFDKICNEEYSFTFVKDITYLDSDFKKICVVFLTMSFGASIVLSFVLFLVLKRLSDPLEKLRIVTGEIAKGNFSIRANEEGKDEFSLLAKDFNIMKDHITNKIDELDRSTKTKQRMLDDLSHEMKTPLTSIRGYAEFLLNAKINEKERVDSLEYIISEVERLKLISERLLDDALIRENGINISYVDISKIIEDVLKSFSLKAEEKRIVIDFRGEEVFCHCDPILIGILFTNIIDNAFKACGNNGKINIYCDVDELNNPYFVVEDNGIGMSDELIEKITEPFYRIDKSRSRIDGGTGLGLSLCDRIVKAHNAKMKFISEVGVGTKVFVNFTNL